jgi:hypothetical protein
LRTADSRFTSPPGTLRQDLEPARARGRTGFCGIMSSLVYHEKRGHQQPAAITFSSALFFAARSCTMPYALQNSLIRRKKIQAHGASVMPPILHRAIFFIRNFSFSELQDRTAWHTVHHIRRADNSPRLGRPNDLRNTWIRRSYANAIRSNQDPGYRKRKRRM